MKASSDNENIAKSCQQTMAACCCRGHIFIPNEEYAEIVEHLNEKSPQEIEEFKSRCLEREGYYLYDQKSKCQFLDDNYLCRLHESQVKPKECYWWPLHVYLDTNGDLEIRVANCCSACLHTHPSHIEKIKNDVEIIGVDLIKKFRSEHSYGKDYRPLAKI